MGAKTLYILDLPRAKVKNDNEEALMAVLKSIADGMVSSTMYRKKATLLMEPSTYHANYFLDYELLSMDRWKVYEIQPDGTLGKENEIFQDIEKRKEILRRQDQKLKERMEAKKLEE